MNNYQKKRLLKAVIFYFVKLFIKINPSKLYKPLCIKCFNDKFHRVTKWGIIYDMVWNKERKIVCYERVKKNNKELYFSIDVAAPKECPYRLEHLLLKEDLK